MSESDDKPFTVTDRRHFTPEGEARDEARAPGVREPAAASSPAAEPIPADAGADGAEARDRRPAGPAPVDFASFVFSLGAQAGVLLSGPPEEGVPPEDALAHAQQIISILEMLQDKTQGRRTPDEDRLLEELLFQLRMAFVQKKREGA